MIAGAALGDAQCDHIAGCLPAASGTRGLGNLITHPTVVQLLQHQQFGECVWSMVGRNLVAVSATLFDRTLEPNGGFEWRQDRMISVRERLDVPGYRAWSVRSGIVQVDAPAQVLAQMLVVRVHLDECGTENGPLRVVPGSHRNGKLDEAQVAAAVGAEPSVELLARRGALLMMRPLLIHSSAPARATEHRRVLQIEVAPAEAISPLQWPVAMTLRRASRPERSRAALRP